MRKFLFMFIFFFMLINVVSANSIPNNIYYVNDGIYAYLEYEDIELTEDQKLYIEYRIKDGDNVETLDLIEFKKNQNTIFLTDKYENVDNLLIDSRYVIFDNNYTYLDWSEESKITLFDFSNKPNPIIANLRYENGFKYDVINKEEIDKYFNVYKKIYNLEITYVEEYEIDDKWGKQIPIDLENIELNFRVYYEIGLIKSDNSNVLNYENHPKTCIFDSTFCCNQIFNVSICIWISILITIIILILIIIDKNRRKKKEA